MPKKQPVGKRATAKPGNALPSMGSSHQFMPNFGVDMSEAMHLGVMGPAFASPGAPDRPQHPGQSDGRRSNKVAVQPKSGKTVRNGAPAALGVPPPPGQRSKAGVPPPPSHGARNKATLPSVKLNSSPGSVSPNLIKAAPLPKIGAIKSKQATSKLANKQPLELTDVEMVLYGHITSELPEAPKKHVRVFLSSTFSDMKAERNEIWTTVYPALRKHCLGHGLDFSFVDMRWGVLDFATDHHKTEEIVLAEVKRTIKVSAATSFLSIIGHRYGSIVNESTIVCDKFMALVEAANANNLKDRKLLEQWYKRDDNNIPPVHILQPISSLLPDYLSDDADKKEAATAEWNRIDQVLWQVKFEATKLAVNSGKLAKEHLENMEKSVTTTEIETGLINNPQATGTTFAIYRKFDGIEKDVDQAATARFIDVEVKDGQTVVNEDRQKKIEKFIASPIHKVLLEESRKKYTVPWHEGGIPTDVSQQTQSDREFLQQLSADLIAFLIKATGLHLSSVGNMPDEYKVPVNESLFSMTDGTKTHVCTPECMMKCALANKNALIQEYNTIESVGNINLQAIDYKEFLHHLRLVEMQTKLFCGRSHQLQQAKEYLQQGKTTSPLIIHGASGGGKTPFAAQVAKSVHKWLGDGAVVAVRFLGSSQAAEQINSMLRGLIVQLSCAYQIPCHVSESNTVRRLSAKLKALLDSVSVIGCNRGRPCVIVLDGLEHLRSVDKNHSLSWLPQHLPPKVFILATINDSLLPASKARFTQFLELPPMTVDDMMDYISLVLKHHSRTLTTEQTKILREHLTTHAYPVYAQMLAKLALETPSHHSIRSSMSDSVHDAVSAFMLRLEKRYGVKFVTHALSYITCGHSGISEIELEDALSCSDEVLVEVYVYHEPPVPGTIRIPPHLWPMLRNELDQLLVEKSTNDYILLSWYHSAVKKVVMERYLSTPELKAKYHNQLAEIYLSRNGVRRTITLTQLRKPITIENADRQIASFDNAEHLPLRVLYSVAHHLSNIYDNEESRKANLDKLKRMTICNLDYIKAMWNSVDLLAMTSITETILQDLIDSGYSDTKEFELMLDFFQNRLSAIGSKECSPELLMDFYVIVLGAFTPDPSTPAINILLDRVNKELSLVLTPLILPAHNCCLFGQDKLRYQFANCDSNVGDVENTNTLISLATCSLRNVKTVDINDARVYSLNCKAKIKCVKLAHKRVFALTEQNVTVQTCSDEHIPQCSFKTDSLSKGDFLNKCMAVSGSSRLVCLGGKDKIAVYEDKASVGEKPQYKAISSLNLGGVKSTESILFTSDEKYTVSAHTIAAKNKCVGGIVRWNYDTQTTEARVSVPSTVLEGTLQLLPDDDKVLCACSKSELLIVSFKEQRVVEKLANGKASWTDITLEDNSLAVVFDNRQVKVWNLQETKVSTLSTQATPTSAALFLQQNLVFVGDEQGSIEVYDMLETKLVKVLHISSYAVTKVKAMSDGYLLAHDASNDVFVLNMENLMEKGTDKPERINSLGSSIRGKFSCDCNSLLVERSLGTSASLYSLKDLAKVDISATTGFNNLSLCGGMSYLVGQKGESVKVWDLAKGQEVVPPPDIKELCDNVTEPYHVFPSQPVVVLANEGRLVEWLLSNNTTTSTCYNRGAAVDKIAASDPLVALHQRSGGYDNWVIQVVDRTSGKMLMTAEREEAVSHMQCLNHSLLYVANGVCYLMDKTSNTKELEQTAPVKYISALHPNNYVVVRENNSVTLVDGTSGQALCVANISDVVLGVVFSDHGFTLLSLPFGRIQLISWQASGKALLSNVVQITCGHLSACIDTSKQQLHIYGRLLDESRLLTFDLKNFQL